MDTSSKDTIVVPAPKHGVHQALAHSYIVYFCGFIVGFVLYFLWDYKLVGALYDWIGVLFLFIGPVLILWAQNASRRSHQKRTDAGETLTHKHFCAGPYCVTRVPTQYGLVLLLIGLGLVLHSLAIVLSTVVAFILARTIFIPKQEAILEATYGQPYQDYKNKVRL